MSTDQLPPEIFKHWIESREDRDITPNVSVYRPSDYKFPPSRGRRGFEIKKNGEFILHEIGSTDRPVRLAGNFSVEAPDKIKVHYIGSSAFTLRIVAIEDNGNILRLERL
ncbi:MAG: hypothetical protein WBN72_08385 [Nitrososphaeraceae archaeon]